MPHKPCYLGTPQVCQTETFVSAFQKRKTEAQREYTMCPRPRAAEATLDPGPTHTSHTDTSHMCTAGDTRFLNDWHGLPNSVPPACPVRCPLLCPVGMADREMRRYRDLGSLSFPSGAPGPETAPSVEFWNIPACGRVQTGLGSPRTDAGEGHPRHLVLRPGAPAHHLPHNPGSLWQPCK